MRRKIIEVLDREINPYVASHGGKITLEDFVDGDVYLRMSGGCQGCASSTATLKQGVERALRKEFGERINRIIDLTDHAQGENPYFH